VFKEKKSKMNRTQFKEEKAAQKVREKKCVLCVQG
jgi:hypothetical protein